MDENLEKKLKEGFFLDMTTKDKIPEIEDRYNLHMGEPYRVILIGINPLVQLTYDGILTELSVFVDSTGFTIMNVVLEDGLTGRDGSGRNYFSKESISTAENRILGFGSILDKKGFCNVRDKIKEQTSV